MTQDPSSATNRRPPVRIALMGMGLIGREHAKLLDEHPETELVAIVDVSAEAGAYAQAHGIPLFSDVERMLDAVAPDGAIIALPNRMHVEAGLACAARGIPFLVEKPVADNVEAAFDLVRAAEAAGVRTMVGHHRRHSPDIREAKRAIARGDLGRVVTLSGMSLARKHDDYFDVAWRRESGGGPLLINAIHDIDCFRYLLGEIDTVEAIASSAVRGFAVEDTVAVAMRFASGALGTFMLSDAVPSPWFWETASSQALYFPHHPADAFFIGGTKASLAIPSLTLWGHEPGGDWRTKLVSSRLPLTMRSAYVAQVDNMVGVFRGEAEPVIDVRDGAMTVAATLAIARSAAEGRPVRIADTLPPGAA
jgi:predicted dehydrogenase